MAIPPSGAPQPARPQPVRPQSASPAPIRPSRFERMRPYIWQGEVGTAFWRTTSIISLLVDLVLILIVLILATQLFALKRLVGEGLVGGLYSNFVKMDEANIRTTITVKDTIIVRDTIPVVFTIPLKAETGVTLTKDAYIDNATVFLNGSGVTTDIILKKGTLLNIYLDMNVPVDQMLAVELKVPVELTVPVDIPLEQTELHEPFVGLQNVVAPYNDLLNDLPNSWTDALCPDWLCGPRP
jgi:hypothetical protein